MTVTWIGANSTDPSDGGNWDNPDNVGFPPGIGDDVLFDFNSNGTFSCVLIADVEWSSLSIVSTNPDFFTGSFTDAGKNITLNGTGTLNPFLLQLQNDEGGPFTLNLTGRIILTGSGGIFFTDVNNKINNLTISNNVNIDINSEGLTGLGTLSLEGGDLQLNSQNLIWGGPLSATGGTIGAISNSLAGRTIQCTNFTSITTWTATSTWFLNASGSVRQSTGGGVDHCNATGSAGVISADFTFDNFNNTNWLFTARWIGLQDPPGNPSWSAAGNWYTNTIPTSATDVVFGLNGNPCFLAEPSHCRSLFIRSDRVVNLQTNQWAFALNMSGENLTVHGKNPTTNYTVSISGHPADDPYVLDGNLIIIGDGTVEVQRPGTVWNNIDFIGGFQLGTDIKWTGTLTKSAGNQSVNGNSLSGDHGTADFIANGGGWLNLTSTTIDCNDFQSDSVSFSPTGTWFLNSFGTTRTFTNGTVSNSNAAGSVGAIDATGPGVVNGGNNINWTFSEIILTNTSRFSVFFKP